MADTEKTVLINIQLNDKDYAAAAGAAKKATEDLKKQINELQKSEGDNTEEIARLTAQMKNQQAEYNNNIKALQAYEKGVQNANNSYDSLYNQWKLAEVQLKKLEGTLQLNADGTIEMSEAYMTASKDVENAKNAINQFGLGVKDGRLNVGNYADAVEGTTRTLTSMQDELVALNKKIKTLDVQSDEFEQMKAQAAALTLEIGQVSGKLDEFGDKEPKNPARKQFEDLTESVLAVTAATEIYTNIMGDNENAQEAAAKAMKAVAIAEGIKQLVAAKGAIIDTANLALTKARTAATWLNTTAQTAYNAVMAAGIPGIGLLAVGVTGLVGGIILLAKNLSFATKEQKLQNEVQKEAAKAASDEMAEFNVLIATIKAAKQGRGDLNQAIEKYNEKYGETGKLTKEAVNNEDALNKIIAEQTRLIQARFQAEAYMEKIKELNKENIEIQQDGVAWYEKAWNSIKTGNNAIQANIENEKSKGKAIADNNKMIDFATQKYIELTQQTKNATKSTFDFAGELKKLSTSAQNDYDKLYEDYQTDFQNYKKLYFEKTITQQEFLKLISQLNSNYENEYKKLQQDAYKNYIDIQNKKRDAAFELEGMIIELRKDGLEKETELAELAYKKEREAIQRKIKEEPYNQEILNKQLNVLAEKFQQDQAAITKKWSDEEFEKALSKKQEEIALKIEATKQGTQAKLDLQKEQLKLQQEADIKEAEETGVSVELIKEKYKAQELELEKEYNQAIYEQRMSDMEALNQAELLQIEMQGGDVTAKQLEQKQREKEALFQFEDETNAEYLLRQEELNKQILDLQQQALNNRIEQQAQAFELMSSFTEGWSNLVSIVDAKSAESAEFQRTMASILIGIETAKALAQIITLATAPDALNLATGGLAVPLKIAGLTVQVLANIAKAKKMLSAKPQGFANGVIDLQGSGTGTSDSIPARLSKGESVMTAKATQMFKPQLAMMNATAKGFANGVIDLNSPTVNNQSTSIINSLSLQDQFAKALQSMPAPILTYKEFSEFQNNTVKYQQRAEL